MPVPVRIIVRGRRVWCDRWPTGRAAIGVGLAVPLTVLLTRDGFPHLAPPVPLALGLALLVT